MFVYSVYIAPVSYILHTRAIDYVGYYTFLRLTLRLTVVGRDFIIYRSAVSRSRDARAKTNNRSTWRIIG